MIEGLFWSAVLYVYLVTPIVCWDIARNPYRESWFQHGLTTRQQLCSIAVHVLLFWWLVRTRWRQRRLGTS